MQTSNLSIRENNIRLVLKQIMLHQPISRATISQNTSLNKASVSEIIKILLDVHLVREVGIGESTHLGGRKPIMLIFNHEAGVSLGIDVGKEKISYKIATLEGTTIEKVHITDNNYKNCVKEILDELSSKYAYLPFGVVGATISIHGIVEPDKIIFTPNYNVVDLEDLIHSYSFPITFINEANAAAYAHHQREMDIQSTIAAITLGSGIGSGIVFNNVVYLGNSGSAGELGHTIVFPQGRICPCGNKGCLEQYASEGAILREFRNVKSNPALTLDDFIEQCNHNDDQSLEILTTIGSFLSIGIGNYIALYAPTKLYLSGEIFQKIPSLVTLIHRNTRSIFTQNTNIEIAVFDAIDGACLYTIDQFVKLAKF